MGEGGERGTCDAVLAFEGYFGEGDGLGCYCQQCGDGEEGAELHGRWGDRERLSSCLNLDDEKTGRIKMYAERESVREKEKNKKRSRKQA